MIPFRFTAAIALSAAAALSTAAVAAQASGPPVALAWLTYLRAGPGETFQAVDELEHGVPVTVERCDARWCRVSAPGVSGFVDRDALDLPAPPRPSPTARACVVAGQADDRRPMPTRFCSPASTVRRSR